MNNATDPGPSVHSEDALHESLKFSRERVVILNTDPAGSAFIVWFVISCYFPVITACLGPIANTISIAGVADKWRSNSSGLVPDPKGIFIVNVISLVIGCTSNFALLLHFAKKLNYVKAQIITITGWSIAGGMLLIVVITCAEKDYPKGYSKTIGFWYAVITVFLYLSCALTLSIHFWGYKRDKYPPMFNLAENERNVMIFTFILSIWFIWGSAMFSQLLNISFGNALYFSTISVLTIGLGDILPLTLAAKIMALVYSLSGVLILGLIIAMTRGIIHSSAGPIFFFHRVERSRVKVYHEVISSGKPLSSKETFEMIKSIRRVSKFKQERASVLATIVVFIVFWLLGALVFYFAEGWSYFNGIYFCFLCLITIGYGDFAPKTGCGRAFFVVWAIGAVPLMTAIISTVGDALSSFANSLNVGISKIIGIAVNSFSLRQNHGGSPIMLERGELFQEGKGDLDEEDAGTDSVTNSTHTPSTGIQRNYEVNHKQLTVKPKDKLTKAIILINAIKKLRRILHSGRSYELTFEEWTSVYTLLQKEGEDDINDFSFWISDRSPLRFPLDEPRFAFSKVFAKLDVTVNEILQESIYNEQSSQVSSSIHTQGRACTAYSNGIRRFRSCSI